MSTIQNDQENLKFRSLKPDPESELSLEETMKVALRDAVVRDLVAKCNELELGLKIQKMWLQHKSHVEEHNQRMTRLQQWDEYLDDAELAYDGTSAIHLPLPMIVLKTFHARMFQALMSVDPPFSVRAMQEAYQDKTEMVYGLMHWTLSEWCNYNEGCEEVVDRWLWNWSGWGNGSLKIRWDRKFTRYIDVEDIFVRGPSEWEVAIDPESGAVEEVEKPTIIRSQRERAVTEKVFDGPVIEYIKKEDLAIIGGRDVQRADAVIHREFKTADWLQSMALQGVFIQEAVDELLKGGVHAEAGKPGMQMAQDREELHGVQTMDIPEDRDKYEILEAHLEVDVNRDGLDESIICWIDNHSGQILRATYAHRINRDGKRPFVNIEFIPREGHAYAMGLLELIHPISVELDMIHNIKVDIGILAAQPFGFYRAATGMDPVKLKVKAGDLIPVDDPASHVNFPNLGDRSGFFKDEEMALLQHVERLTAINDINTATLGRQGAARTATGVSALVSENSANLDIFIKRMQRGWRQVLRLVWAQLQQRLPDGTEFRVTGIDGKEYFKSVNRIDIQQRIDFALEANSANSNKQIQLENSMQVLAQTMNPLFLQVGIVTPMGMFEALKDYFQALGRKDYARFIQRPPAQPRMLTAEEELRRILAGKSVPVSPEQDHEGFLELADAVLAMEGVDAMYGSDRLEAVQAQIQQHKAMLEAMQKQAAQQAQANQQMFNGMGAGGAAAPGMVPFSNPYNDFQASRASLMNQLGDQTGMMIPGSQKGP